MQHSTLNRFDWFADLFVGPVVSVVCPARAGWERGASSASSSARAGPAPARRPGHSRCACAWASAPSGDAPAASKRGAVEDDEVCECCGGRKSAELGAGDCAALPRAHASRCALGSINAQGAALAHWSARSIGAIRAAADCGSVAAAFVLGTNLLHGSHGAARDPAEAVRWLACASDAHVAAAQVSLGAALEIGTGGLAVDASEAVRLYRLAAVAGFAEAHKFLGMCLLSGSGVSADAAKAVRQFQIGAEAGCSAAMVELAEVHLQGVGVARSHGLALTWAKAAVASGERSGRAHSIIGGIEVLGGQDDMLAARHFAAAARAGSVSGTGSLVVLVGDGGKLPAARIFAAAALAKLPAELRAEAEANVLKTRTALAKMPSQARARAAAHVLWCQAELKLTRGVVAPASASLY